jgi:hypothetical protein
MGDTYQLIVPINVKDEMEGEMLIGKMFLYFTAEKIIEANEKQFQSTQFNSFEPGENWQSAVEFPTEEFLAFEWNTVRFLSGKEVYNAYGVDSVRCPYCDFDVVETNWHEKMDEWMNETGNDSISCSKCGQSASITKYIFNPLWAFGYCAVQLWNWPDLSSAFVEKISASIKHELVVVAGKI